MYQFLDSIYNAQVLGIYWFYSYKRITLRSNKSYDIPCTAKLNSI